jgi:membrane associated rhomboid family serine protease
MGLADRDYARSSPPPQASPRMGRMRVLSVNTWIIIINVAVYVIGHWVMVKYDPQVRHTVPIEWRVSAGTFYFTKTTEEQRKHQTVDPTRLLPIPEMPGYYGYPIVAPASDPATGRPIVALNGKPEMVLIGFERYTQSPPLDAVGHFSTGKGFLEGQVWRFITFQFLHRDVPHIAFNMLGLWFVGGLVEEYLGRRRYLAFYLVSGLFGAVGYLTLNLLGFLAILLYPGLRGGWTSPLLFDDIYTPLIGASAGVFGVLMAAAYIAPSAIVEVMFVIPMRLRTAVYLFLGLAVFNLVRGAQNAGGEAAHVGGAIAGAFFIRRTHLLRDFFDLFSDSRKARHAPPSEGAAVDRILGKIRDHGLESLTPSEREILHRESEAARGRIER